MHHINHAMFIVCRVVRQMGDGEGGGGGGGRTGRKKQSNIHVSMRFAACRFQHVNA